MMPPIVGEVGVHGVEDKRGETNVEGAVPLGGVGGLVPGAWLEAELVILSLSRSGALDQAAVERCSVEVDIVLDGGSLSLKIDR